MTEVGYLLHLVRIAFLFSLIPGVLSLAVAYKDENDS